MAGSFAYGVHMTRHSDAEGNAALDRSRIRRLSIAVVVLLAACLVVLVGPAVAPHAEPSGSLGPWPEQTEPRPHPDFTKAKETPTDVTPATPTAAAPTAAGTTTERADRAPTERPTRTTAATTTAAPGTATAEPDDQPAPEPAPAEPAPADGSVLGLVNHARSVIGCGPVSGSAALDTYAAGHSQEQASTDTMHHSEPAELDALAGTWGENVAVGYPDPASVMAAWMDSPGHRANIENCAFTSMGIGTATGPSGLYWTQVFTA